MQFLYVSLEPDTVAALQSLIPTRIGMSSYGPLAGITYPIVQRENGDQSSPNWDWRRYVDEYDGYGGPGAGSWPGIAVIDKTGAFSGVRAYPAASYNAHSEVDWVVKTVDQALGGRQPVDIVLALDRSGSMASLPPSGGAASKMDVLKDAVGVFLDVWESHSVPKDRAGTVDFDDAVSQLTQSGTGSPLLPLATEANIVRSYVQGLYPDGLTCIGGAVAKSVDALSASARKHVILFSDGMQNFNPVLARLNYQPDIRILDVDPANVANYELVECIYGDSGIPPKPAQTLRSFNTHIHTIGVGVSGQPWSDLMTGVAAETDGCHFETPAPEVDLQNFYLNALIDSLQGATPQLLRHSYGTFDSTRALPPDDCWVNTSCRWLSVVLSWQGDPDHNQLQCNLEAPDGTLVEISGRTRWAPRRLAISLPLPVYHRDRLIDHVGRWRLRVTGATAGAVGYQVFWVADDPRVHFDVVRLDRQYCVGDTLLAWASLLEADDPVPLSRLEECTLRVASPVVDADRFLREHAVPVVLARQYEKGVEDRDLSPANGLKLWALTQDGEALSRYTKKRTQAVRMTCKEGKATHAIRLAKSGLHTLSLEASGVDRRRARISRTRTISVWVAPKPRSVGNQ